MRLRKKYSANTGAYLNFAVTDGCHTLTTRFATSQSIQPASLFYGQGILQDDDGKISFKTLSENKNNCIIICSEPLTEDKQHWQKVERNHLVKANGNISISQALINLPYQDQL